MAIFINIPFLTEIFINPPFVVELYQKSTSVDGETGACRGLQYVCAAVATAAVHRPSREALPLLCYNCYRPSLLLRLATTGAAGFCPADRRRKVRGSG